MSKQEEFLWIVQTTILANCVNLASNPEWAEQYRHEISASGIIFSAAEAISVSSRIPEDMRAREATHEFCTFVLQNLKETQEEATGSSLSVPNWFARP
ncbi:MAG: hypothetical protein ABSG62_00780 [Terracidiphilus sp.]|jgi:hypothetical protein